MRVKVAVKAAATVADAVAGAGEMVVAEMGDETVAEKAAGTVSAAKAEQTVASALIVAKPARPKLPAAKRAATPAARAVAIAANVPIVARAAAVARSAASALRVKRAPVSRPSTQRASKSAHRPRAAVKAEVNRAVKAEARAAVAHAPIASPAAPTRWRKAPSRPRPCHPRRSSTHCRAPMHPRAASPKANVRAHDAATGVAVGAVVTATTQQQALTTTRPPCRPPKQRISPSAPWLKRVMPRQHPRPHAAKALTARRRPVKAAAVAGAVTAIVANGARKRVPTTARSMAPSMAKQPKV